MGEVKQINIKNRTYYFYNDMINLKRFGPNLLKLTENLTKTLVFTTSDILQLKKLMIIIYSADPLYFQVNQANGYIEEKK